jgi:hypothetical protein
VLPWPNVNPVCDENSVTVARNHLTFPFTMDLPQVVSVHLVGTGFTAAAKAAAPLTPNSRYTYRLDNVPEGDYWLLASYTTSSLCQVTVVPAASTVPGATTQRVQWAGAAMSVAAPGPVTAGQVTTVPDLRVIEGYIDASDPSWIGNDTLIYDLTGGSFSNGNLGPGEIWTVGPDDQPSALTNAGTDGSWVDPAASPAAGRLIALHADLDGTTVGAPTRAFAAAAKSVTSALAINAAADIDIVDGGPAWAPDGAHIAFRSAGAFNILPPGLGQYGDLWIKNLVDGTEKSLTQFNFAGGEGAMFSPAWSPDLSQIAITYTRDGGKTTDIRIINVADGSGFNLTTDGRSRQPSWTRSAGLADFPMEAFLGGPMGTTPRPPGATVPGDLDGDGKVTVLDATLALRIAVGLQQSTPGQLAAGDLHHTEGITVADVTEILRAAVGLQTLGR